MVSVIMPCYNAGKYLGDAIESVVLQTYKDWELIVINDGSTDNSAVIAGEFADKDDRIRIIDQQKSGACKARNVGIQCAKGEYIKFLDADDLLYPTALENQINQIKELNDRQIPFGDYDNVDENGNLLSEFVFDKQDQLNKDPVAFFFSEWHLLISCPLHRTVLLKELNGFNEELKRGQEADLHLRMALHDIEWIYFPNKQFKYREYSAPHRISCTSREKSYTMARFREQRMMICEKLFIEKYTVIPSIYRKYFRDGWFNKARREFYECKKNDGLNSISQMKCYLPLTSFQQIYIKLGNILGFMFVEKLLRLRLKVLRKNWY